MRKIMIFSTSTGGGHNQVAYVLSNEFSLCGYEVEISDFLKETSRLLDLCIASGYNKLAVKSKNVYGIIYSRCNEENINHKLNMVFLKILKAKLISIINNYNPDLIVTTHPIVVNILGTLKACGEINAPIISVVTDFDVHNFYINHNIDAYIASCNHTRQVIISKGISADRVFSFGIPVKRDFWTKSYRDNNKLLFTILLMGGSIGLIYLRKALKTLLNNPNPMRILVVCGNNPYLKAQLEDKYADINSDKEVIIYGFSNDIPALMDQADLIISKPGGVTTSEAIAKNKPLLIPYAIPGQEEENTRILVDHGVAVRADNVKKLNELVSSFISSPQLLNELSRNMKELSKNQSLDNIINLADRLMVG